MTVALTSAHSTHLRVPALESFVANLLAVVALVRPRPTFEDSRVSRFASRVEEALIDEPLSIAGFGDIYHHRSIRFRSVLPAQPSQLGDLHVVLSAQGFRRSGEYFAFRVENGRTVDVVNFDWVQLVT